ISEPKMARYINIELQHFHRVNFSFYLFEPKTAVYNEPNFTLLAYFCAVEHPRYLHKASSLFDGRSSHLIRCE
ncbi:hypothetical protein CWC09_19205, partial [Pseudoalteromonas ruthenica]